MKTSLYLTTGLITGFALATFTPLGEMGSFDKVKSLAGETLELAQEVGREGLGKEASSQQGLRDLNQFKSLIASARKEPSGNILQNEEIVMAAGFIDPESLWAMQFAEIERPNGLTRASLDEDITSSNAEQSNISQSAPRLAEETDQKTWHARTSALELDRLRRTVDGLDLENQTILKGLETTEATHPDYHMALCVHESNDGLIAFYSFLITMGESGASAEDTAALAQALAEERNQIETHIRIGRTTAAAHRQVLEGLPVRNEDEARIKKQALEYYDSFLLSFEVEATLATHLLAYPDLIAKAIETGEPPYGVSEWVASFQELGRSRMELQAYRQTIANNLAGPGS